MRVPANLVASCQLLSACGGPPPSDSALEQNFQTNRAAFEHLKTLACASAESQQVSMSPEWSRPEIGPTERATYYPLLKQVGAFAIYSEGNCSFAVPTWHLGRSQVRGYSHGSYLLADGRTVSVKSIDSLSNGTGEVTFYIRPLRDNWNIYHVQWHK